MKKTFRWILIAAIWLAIWQIAALIAGHEVYLSSPLSTLNALFSLIGEEEFLASVAASIARIMCGFILGMAFGALIALLSYKNTFLRDFFKPLLSVVKATPVASFIILALVWFTKTSVPALTSALIVIPVTFSNLYGGLIETDKALLEMASCFKMKPLSKLRHIYFPSLTPYLNAAVTSGLGMAWKSGIAAEVIANPNNSIGSQLFDAKIYLETDMLFAWTIVVIVLSVVIEKLTVKLLAKLTKRRQYA